MTTESRKTIDLTAAVAAAVGESNEDKTSKFINKIKILNVILKFIFFY